MTSFPWLTLLIFIPLAGAITVFAVKERSVRLTALGVAVADLLISLPLWWLFDASSGQMQFVESARWIPSLSINYRLGLDGISLPLILMTTVLMPLCILISWHSIERRIRSFMAMLLIMESAMIGVFCALDFVLFYVFWEAMLIPMYLLIGIWGGPNRLYAAIKFCSIPAEAFAAGRDLGLYFQGGHIRHCSIVKAPIQFVAILALPRVLRRIRRQSSHVPLPYMAARRARGSTHCRQCHTRQRTAQDGHLWVSTFQRADVA